MAIKVLAAERQDGYVKRVKFLTSRLVVTITRIDGKTFIESCTSTESRLYEENLLRPSKREMTEIYRIFNAIAGHRKAEIHTAPLFLLNGHSRS